MRSHRQRCLLLGAITAAACSAVVPLSPLPAVCQTLSAGVVVVDAVGGGSRLLVGAALGCGWVATVAPESPWVRVTSAGGQAGPGEATIYLEPNRTFVARSGRVLIQQDGGENAGRELQLIVIEQRAATCLYSVIPAAEEFHRFGTWDGSGESPHYVQVRAEPTSCQWTVAADASWIRFHRGQQSGTGNMPFGLLVNPNLDGPPRTGSVTVAGLSGVNPSATYTISQQGR